MTIEHQGGNRLNATARCDEPGCPNSLGRQYLVSDNEPGDGVRWHIGDRTGWTTKGDKHYCADHG